MSKLTRNIIMSFLSVLVVAAIVTVVLVAIKSATRSNTDVAPGTTSVEKNDASKTDPAHQEDQTTPDLSKDLGACTAVTKAVVVAAIGSKIQTYGELINRGYAQEVGGIESQSCTLAFTPSDEQDSRYTTTVTVFSNGGSVKTSKAAFTNMTNVAGIGDVAYYQTIETPASEGTAAWHSYNFYVFSGQKLYTLTIAQPADNDVFVSNSAQTALTTIAKSISFR